jgi:hypothetical protein
MNMFSEGAERNKALGIWGGVGALAGTVGLLAGGVLTTYAAASSITAHSRGGLGRLSICCRRIRTLTC